MLFMLLYQFFRVCLSCVLLNLVFLDNFVIFEDKVLSFIVYLGFLVEIAV